MKRHPDAAQDRALITSMLPTDASGALRVNPACAPSAEPPVQLGEVPLARTMRKPDAYKATKGAP